MKIWTCKIGEVTQAHWETLGHGLDFPMRRAVEEAYRRITGEEPRFIFSGWGGELDPIERELVESTGVDAQVVTFE
jgi:hypothetical protein